MLLSLVWSSKFLQVVLWAVSPHMPQCCCPGICLQSQTWQVAGSMSCHCAAGARGPKGHSDLHAVLLLSPPCPPAAALAGTYLLAGAMQCRDSTPAYPHTCIGMHPC